MLSIQKRLSIKYISENNLKTGKTVGPLNIYILIHTRSFSLIRLLITVPLSPGNQYDSGVLSDTSFSVHCSQALSNV